MRATKTKKKTLRAYATGGDQSGERARERGILPVFLVVVAFCFVFFGIELIMFRVFFVRQAGVSSCFRPFRFSFFLRWSGWAGQIWKVL